MTFVDIGAGTGFFSRAASDIVGESGRVFALDMSEAMLDILKKNGVANNVHAILTEEYLFPIEKDLSDLTLLAFVLHENTDIHMLLAEVSRVTKPSGAIAIIEWKKQDEAIGPPKDERLGQDELLPFLSSFEIAEQGDLTASHYYAIIRRKSQ